MSASFTATLGPNVTFQDPSGSILLTPITKLTLAVTTAAAGTEAEGSASVNDGTLEMLLSVPTGPKGDDATLTPATRESLGGVIVGGGFGLGSDGTIVVNESISALSGTALAFSTDGSRSAVTLTPSEATTLTLSGGKAGVLHELILIVKQGDTPFAVTLPANATLVGNVTVADTANAVSMIRFVTVDGGTTYLASTY